MKILELREGTNVVRERLKILGIFKPINGNIYLNNEPLILNKTTSPFPAVSLDHLRDYTTKEEIYFAYKFLKPQIVREMSNLTSSDKVLLVVEETDEDWDMLDVLLLQFEVQADGHGKIDFKQYLTQFSVEDIGDVFYLNKIIFMPESEVKLKRFNLFNWDLVFDELVIPDVPIYHLVPVIFVGGNTETVIWGETTPNSKMTIIFELLRDRYQVISEALLEEMRRFMHEKEARV